MPLERQMRVVDPTSPEPEGACGCGGGGKVRVAFASSDLDVVDEHFGSATRLAVYDVGCHSSELSHVAEFSPADRDGNENKLIAKFEALKGCHAVFSLAVGSSAVRQLVAMGVQPIKLGDASPVAEVLDYLQGEVREGETPWIRKAVGGPVAPAEDRVAAMLEEGWDE